MGHSLQAISLLVHCAAGQVAAVPLASRIHEGLVFSNRDTSTLLDKLAALLMRIAGCIDRQVLLVADACYASAKVLTPLLEQGHHLISRAKSNAVAYLPAPEPQRRGKGRPRVYGEKVRWVRFKVMCRRLSPIQEVGGPVTLPFPVMPAHPQ